jgi:quercetin dioxygenase-like cupin family protein
MSGLEPRVVTTGLDPAGRPALLSDQRERASSHGAASVAQLHRSAGVTVLLFQLAASDWPASGGWRQVPTQDITTVLTGELLVELDTGSALLEPGDTLVQRGTRHRMRAIDGPVTALVTHLETSEGAPDPALTIGRGEQDHDPRVRRVVTGVDDDGRSCVVHDGEPAWVLQPSPRVLMADAWQTGGPLASVAQGGDAPGPWQRTPLGGGVLAGTVVQGPGDYDFPEAWHATPTVDVDLITEGHLELWLPDLPPVELAPGDIVLQQGVNHRWQPVGENTTRMVTVMVGSSDHPLDNAEEDSDEP